ncbi:hypothetical protein IH879_19430 [candidate division KSB1 bacterium]|nr:hypothetical protein [candidate division KSB1 bacterium]
MRFSKGSLDFSNRRSSIKIIDNCIVNKKNKRLMEAEEELEDIRAYDEVKEKVDAELNVSESVTLESYKANKK